jgi:hypothetical protein
MLDIIETDVELLKATRTISNHMTDVLFAVSTLKTTPPFMVSIYILIQNQEIMINTFQNLAGLL